VVVGLGILMPRLNASVNTEFGPVDFDVLKCDGPNCKTAPSTPGTVVNWIRTDTLGTPVQTFQSVDWTGKTFCSVECLVIYATPGA